MTSQGTPHGRFQRAIQRRHLLAAEMAAREMETVNLAEAVGLVCLVAEVAPALRSPVWRRTLERAQRDVRHGESRLQSGSVRGWVWRLAPESTVSSGSSSTTNSSNAVLSERGRGMGGTDRPLEKMSLLALRSRALPENLHCVILPTMAGHLFVVRSDLTKITCDAWLVPSDTFCGVEDPWVAALPSALRSRDAICRAAPEGFGRTTQASTQGCS